MSWQEEVDCTYSGTLKLLLAMAASPRVRLQRKHINPNPNPNLETLMIDYSKCVRICTRMNA